MEDINITLETLYDVLRNEKKKEDLQKLESTFFVDVVSYVREKKSFLDSKDDEDELFAANEREKLDYELRSIKRILKEIYEKREKKIIEIALNKSRTRSDIIDTTTMLREEKEFYDQIMNTLDGFRKGILLNLFKGELPDVFKEGIKRVNIDVKKKKEVNKSLQEEETNRTEELEKTEVENETEVTKEVNETEQKDEIQEEEETKSSPGEKKIKIRFLDTVNSFVWKDMQSYGPYEEGEETEMFEDVARLLIEKNKAEELDDTVYSY